MPLPSKRKTLTLAEKAALLRSFGYRTRYGTKKRGTTKPQSKAAVTRAWNKIAPYVAGTKQKFKFFPIHGKNKKAVSRKQRTPGGIFAHVPRGVEPGKFQFTVDDAGTQFSRARGPRGGVRREETHSLNPMLLADDPILAIKSIMGRKKPSGIHLVVNGNDAISISGEHGYPLAIFFDYFPEKLAEIMDPTEEQRRKHGDKGMDEEQFSDIFQVKFIYQEKSKPRKKKTKPAVKRNKKHAVPKKTKKRKSRSR